MHVMELEFSICLESFDTKFVYSEIAWVLNASTEVWERYALR